MSIVLENLSAGATAERLHDYPTLPEEAIPAALAYSADLPPRSDRAGASVVVARIKLDENGRHDVALPRDEQLAGVDDERLLPGER